MTGLCPYIGICSVFNSCDEAGQPGDVRTAARPRSRRSSYSEPGSGAQSSRRGGAEGHSALVEELARDVAGWRARAVEFYQALGVTQAIESIW